MRDAKQIYFDYVDGLITKNNIPNNAKQYQADMDKWYKTFIGLHLEIDGNIYYFKNGEVKVDGHQYSLIDGRVTIGGKTYIPQRSGLRYEQLPEGAQHKVDVMIARAMLYNESKNLSNKLAGFAIDTNSTNPPYFEYQDRKLFNTAPEHARIGTFASYIKKHFDDKVGIDFGHGSLNTYGLMALIDYKKDIINKVKNNGDFCYNTQNLDVMTNNSDILMSEITSASNNMQFDSALIGKFGNPITNKIAKSYLAQVEFALGGLEFAKTCKNRVVEYYKTKENINTTHDYETEDEPVYFDQNDYPLTKDSAGNWTYASTGLPYRGVVNLEDGCPVDISEGAQKPSEADKKQPARKSMAMFDMDREY